MGKATLILWIGACLVPTLQAKSAVVWAAAAALPLGTNETVTKRATLRVTFNAAPQQVVSESPGCRRASLYKRWNCRCLAAVQQSPFSAELFLRKMATDEASGQLNYQLKDVNFALLDESHK